jgi:hypothetical protein
VAEVSEPPPPGNDRFAENSRALRLQHWLPAASDRPESPVGMSSSTKTAGSGVRRTPAVAIAMEVPRQSINTDARFWAGEPGP